MLLAITYSGLMLFGRTEVLLILPSSTLGVADDKEDSRVNASSLLSISSVFLCCMLLPQIDLHIFFAASLSCFTVAQVAMQTRATPPTVIPRITGILKVLSASEG